VVVVAMSPDQLSGERPLGARLLYEVWRVDKARQQRSIKWPWRKKHLHLTQDRSHQLVVEQTRLRVATYLPPRGMEGGIREELCGEFLSVCAEGDSPDALHHFMSSFLASLSPKWEPEVAGYPAWIVGLSRRRDGVVAHSSHAHTPP